MTLTDLIYTHLEQLGIEYRKMSHEAVTSSADAARVRGVALRSGAKALVVKAGESFSMFVIPGDRQLDWKTVKRTLGSKSARFATDEELYGLTGLVKGSVPPFGNLLGLPVFVDQDVLAEPLVRFNAGSLTDSIEMAGPALARATDGARGVYAT